MRMNKVVLIVGILLFVVLGALLPFIRQPEVTEETKESLDLSRFYSDELSGERAKVISQNGEALEERIRLISQAKKKVILSTFEFDSDRSGKIMLAALADAAQRGVEISILVDGFPYLTSMWGNPYFLALAGMKSVEIKIYSPVRPWKPWAFMGRLHDKYLIVDDVGYILGGRNTFDYFLGDQPGYKNYDWDVFVYTQKSKGDRTSLNQVEEYFTSVWERPECKVMGKSFFWKINLSVKTAKKELETLYQEVEKEHSSWLETVDYKEKTLPVNHIELISNPTHRFAKEPVVFYTMTELMKQAKEEVVFHTPYVICDTWMLEQLEAVCAQADTVMMTNSVANNGNPFGAMDYQKHKGEILDTGVEILEYDGGVSYHGKCFTMDDRISGVGSFNWDMRSAYLDTELMLVIDSVPLNQQLREEMERYEQDTLKVLTESTYNLKEGQEMQKISAKKEFRIKALGMFAEWARFLM